MTQADPAAVEMSVARRVAGALVALVAVACAAKLLVWAAGSPVAQARLLAVGRSDFDLLLPAAAGLLAWLGLGWFAVLLGLEFGSLCPWRAGRLCTAAATRFAPCFARSCARWVLGVALVAGPLVSTSAMAASPSGGSPNLDRPVATAVAVASPTARPIAQPGDPTTASLDLDRPSGGYVPPAPSPIAKTAPAGASVLAPAPRREVVDDGYVVHRGDTLWDVAARHLGAEATAADIAREWPRWYAANQSVIGLDPGVLHPGQVLHAPRR